MVTQAVRTVLRPLTTSTRSLNMGRVVPEIDPDLAAKIQDKSMKPKSLVTRRNMGFVRLPARLHLAAELKIKQIADRFFRREAFYLSDVLYRQKLPDDQDSIKYKEKDLKTELLVRGKLLESADYDPSKYQLAEDQVIARDKLRQLVQGKLDDKRRDWHYYEYDEFASVLYMAVRLPPNYASVYTILKEIRDLNPEFSPQSVLDYGSGLGTTMWAVNQNWPNSVKEFLNVDISPEQQHLSEFLLRGGKEFGDPLPNVYHRQYLPASTVEKYDIVVSSFSLVDLPTTEMRTQAVETLWQKTKDILIIVERGNHDGFTAVLEARQLVLDLSGHGVTKRLAHHPETKPRPNVKLPQAHVLSPCSHEFSCPRLTFSPKLDLNTCNFKIAFEPLNIGMNKGGLANDTFSYVVLRKGPHPNYLDDTIKPRCPRIIAPRIKSSGQMIHKLCCPNGDIAEVVFTKFRYGKEIYEMAKSVDWGDMIPIKVIDNYIKKNG